MDSVRRRPQRYPDATLPQTSGIRIRICIRKPHPQPHRSFQRWIECGEGATTPTACGSILLPFPPSALFAPARRIPSCPRLPSREGGLHRSRGKGLRGRKRGQGCAGRPLRAGLGMRRTCALAWTIVGRRSEKATEQASLGPRKLRGLGLVLSPQQHLLAN